MGEDIASLDEEIAAKALDDASVARLITITGVSLRGATSLVAAIGDVRRCAIRTWTSPDMPSRRTSTLWHNGKRGQSCADAPGRKGCHEAAWRNSHPMLHSLLRNRPRANFIARFCI